MTNDCAPPPSGASDDMALPICALSAALCMRTMLTLAHGKHMGAASSSMYCADLANCEQHLYFERHQKRHAHARYDRPFISTSIDSSPLFIASTTRRPSHSTWRLRRRSRSQNAAPRPDASEMRHGTNSDGLTMVFQLIPDNIVLRGYVYAKHIMMAHAKALVFVLKVALLCQMRHSTHPVPRLEAPKGTRRETTAPTTTGRPLLSSLRVHQHSDVQH